MHEASRSAPVLTALVLVAGFVLLFVYATPTTDARGDPLVILEIPRMEVDESCRDTFDIGRGYERMSLGYRFDVAIKPRITVTDPAGTSHQAQVEDRNLTLQIDRPAEGTWSIDVSLQETAGLRPTIQNGTVFLLGFPATEAGGTRPSICTPSMSTA